MQRPNAIPFAIGDLFPVVPFWAAVARRPVSPLSKGSSRRMSRGCYAVDRLARIRTPAADQALATLACGETGYDLWAVAVRRLVERGDSRVTFEALRRLYEIESRRSRAVELMRHVSHPDAIGLLCDATKSADSWVAKHAAESLVALDATSAAPAVAVWLAAWRPSSSVQTDSRTFEDYRSIVRWAIGKTAGGHLPFENLVDALKRGFNPVSSMQLLLRATLEERSPLADRADSVMEIVEQPPYLSLSGFVGMATIGTARAIDRVCRLLIENARQQSGSRFFSVSGCLPPAVLEGLLAFDRSRALRVAKEVLALAPQADRTPVVAWLIEHGVSELKGELLEAIPGTLDNHLAALKLLDAFTHLKMGEANRPVADLVAAMLQKNGRLWEPGMRFLMRFAGPHEISRPVLEAMASLTDYTTSVMREQHYLEYVPGIGDVDRTEMRSESEVISNAAVRDYARAELERRA